MRTSNDIYKLSNGSFLSLNQMTEPPKDALIWTGYDYKNQEWVFKGKKDIRSLEELKGTK